MSLGTVSLLLTLAVIVINMIQSEIDKKDRERFIERTIEEKLHKKRH